MSAACLQRQRQRQRKTHRQTQQPVCITDQILSIGHSKSACKHPVLYIDLSSQIGIPNIHVPTVNVINCYSFQKQGKKLLTSSLLQKISNFWKENEVLTIQKHSGGFTLYTEVISFSSNFFNLRILQSFKV